MNSIRRDLLVWLLAAVVTLVALTALATYRIAREEANELFDYHLRQLALSLSDQSFAGAALPRKDEDFDFVIQVWSQDGIRIYFSHPHSSIPDQARLGFATVRTREGAWRVFSTQRGSKTVQVAQPMSVRDRLAFSATLRTLLPFLALLPVLAAMIWVIVGRGLRPLGQVARAVTSRSPSALDPLPERGLPAEVKPLVHALNDLLQRLKGALAAQRSFIADAAHELRTPLAALQLQAQLTERAQDSDARTAALTELKLGLQRTAHVVQQLLTLARQEPGGAERPLAPVRLGELARRIIAELTRLAQQKDLDLGASAIDDEVIVAGDAEALRSLLSNLIENAIRYTPRGGTIDVAIGAAARVPFLEVSDSGPGIPVHDRERVFDRFYRREETAESGTGLGLAIVKAVTQRHGARVSLGDSRLGGLSVRVEFPAAANARAA